MLDQIELNDIEAIALEAGNTIMEIYNRDFTIEYKDDKSPLTEADLASNEVIIKAFLGFLKSFYAERPILL